MAKNKNLTNAMNKAAESRFQPAIGDKTGAEAVAAHEISQRTGRPRKEFDKKTFTDLVGLGCTQEEICWFFRDETGKSANIDTLTRWCKREFGMTFQEYFAQNGFMEWKIQLRKNQFELSKKSAAMAIFLGKNYLGQRDSIEYEDRESLSKLDEILESMRLNAIKPETE